MIFCSFPLQVSVSPPSRMFVCFTTQLSAELPHPINPRFIHQNFLHLSLSSKHSYLDRETSLILRNIAGKPSHLLTKVTPHSLVHAPPLLLHVGILPLFTFLQFA